MNSLREKIESADNTEPINPSEFVALKQHQFPAYTNGIGRLLTGLNGKVCPLAVRRQRPAVNNLEMVFRFW